MNPVSSHVNNLQKLRDLTELNTILFLHFQIDQHKAETLIRILALVFLSVPLSQFPNIFETLIGGGSAKEICTIHHIILAKGQSRNRCSIVSSESQKQHFVLPFHFRLAKLSLVSRTFLRRNHMKILILRGILSFHRYFQGNLGRPFIKSSYIVLTENIPVVERFQINQSGSSVS